MDEPRRRDDDCRPAGRMRIRPPARPDPEAVREAHDQDRLPGDPVRRRRTPRRPSPPRRPCGCRPTARGSTAESSVMPRRRRSPCSCTSPTWGSAAGTPTRSTSPSTAFGRSCSTSVDTERRSAPWTLPWCTAAPTRCSSPLDGHGHTGPPGSWPSAPPWAARPPCWPPRKTARTNWTRLPTSRGPMNYLDAEIYTAGEHITVPTFFAVAPR